jgi:hypothetical protein
VTTDRAASSTTASAATAAAVGVFALTGVEYGQSEYPIDPTNYFRFSQNTPANTLNRRVKAS